MAFLEFKNVKISGVAAAVPERIFSNTELRQGMDFSSDYTPEAFINSTGVKERRLGNLTASDLGYFAAEKLIYDLGWQKQDVEALIFVSQMADYFLPATACILQDRLGLQKDCYAMDIAMGCSGWVYGLNSAASLISANNIHKVLLIAGDAKRRAHYDDPLFGHAATATAIEYDENGSGLKFHFGTDGSGFDAIIIPDGGARNQITEKSFHFDENDGKLVHRLQPRMKGMDVFAFGITTAPKSIKMLGERFKFDYLDYDYYLFHQANMKMNNQIVKKLKLSPEKVPSCMFHFGNTSSASIPLTIVTELSNLVYSKPTKFICCGFGVGLSWGTVAFETNSLIVSELVEVSDENGINNKYVV